MSAKSVSERVVASATELAIKGRILVRNQQARIKADDTVRTLNAELERVSRELSGECGVVDCYTHVGYPEVRVCVSCYRRLCEGCRVPLLDYYLCPGCARETLDEFLQNAQEVRAAS